MPCNEVFDYSLVTYLTAWHKWWIEKMDINTIYNESFVDTFKRLKDESIDLIVTDPPYGMSFVSGHRKVKHDKIENDNNLDWLPEFADESYRVLKDPSHLYCFCSYHNIDIFKQQLERKFTVKNILIWEKNNASMGDLKGDFAPKYEMIIFCHKGGRKLLNGGRDSNIIYSERTMNKLHPTQKPTKLIRFLISKSSDKGDIIYDPFMGSGTTAIAAIREGRDYIGSEIFEKYCNVANERVKDELSQLNLFL